MAFKEASFEHPQQLVDFVNGKAAFGNMLVIPKARITNGGSFLLNDGAVAVRFYFDVSGAFTPGGGYDATHVQVDVSGVATDADVALAVEAAVNGATLDITASIDPDQDPRVLFVNDNNGVIGNQLITIDSSLYEIKIKGLDGGTDGVAQADVIDVVTKDKRWFLYFED